MSQEVHALNRDQVNHYESGLCEIQQFRAVGNDHTEESLGGGATAGIGHTLRIDFSRVSEKFVASDIGELLFRLQPRFSVIVIGCDQAREQFARDEYDECNKIVGCAKSRTAG